MLPHNNANRAKVMHVMSVQVLCIKSIASKRNSTTFTGPYNITFPLQSKYYGSTLTSTTVAH